MNRRRVLAVVATGVIVFTAAGFVLGQSLKSPGQKAAEAHPPPPTVTSVPIATKQLRSAVQVMCSATHERVVELRFDDGAESGKAIVTRVGAASEGQFAIGSLLMEINGRPVFVFPGELEFYRDLRVGMSGPDVFQLQEGLRTLGHLSAQADGEFGQATLAAVIAFYDERGYDTPVDERAQPISSAPIEGSETSGQESPGTQRSVGHTRYFQSDEVIVTSTDRVSAIGELPTRGSDISNSRVAFGAGTQMLQCAAPSGRLPTSLVPGQSVILSDFPDLAGFTVADIVHEPSPASQTGSVVPDVGVAESGESARIIVPADAQLTKSRYVAQVVIELGPADALTVPASAVWTTGAESFVTVSQRGKKPSTRDVPVKVVFSSEGECNIAGALEVGQEVIVDGRS